MDYLKWAEEHERDASNLLKTIEKYEQQIKNKEVTNLELINSRIFNLKNTYNDLLNTAAMLRAKGLGKLGEFEKVKIVAKKDFPCGLV